MVHLLISMTRPDQGALCASVALGIWGAKEIFIHSDRIGKPVAVLGSIAVARHPSSHC